MSETDGASVDQEYRRYVAEIDLYEKEFKPWESRGKKVLKLYKDADNTLGKRKRFNVLWSNVQTLLPACYARDPQPVAERRFKDADPVGRTASEVLERCLSYTIDCQDMGHTMRQLVTDRLLPGRGVAWVRYVPTMEGEGDAETVAYESAIPDYVYWEDFGHSIARVWEEVSIVWRKVYMTRAKLVQRFGDVGKLIPLDYTPKGLKDEKTSEDIKKACIYEGWDKDASQVFFLSKSHPKIIEKKPDPLELTGFFPTPRPLFATLTTDSLVPVADYALYQTQAQELEELTVRIDGLQDALKLRGAYDSSAPALAQILAGAGNKLIPVDNWAKFSEKGGIDGSIQFVPIKEVAETLIALYEAREKSKQDLYEITGLADIIRGNSEPEETATAQQIKGRFAVLRISDTQSDVQRFARDLIRLLGEIIAEHFSLETIKAISGVRLMTAEEKQAKQQELQLAQETGQQPPEVPPEVEEMLRQPTWEEVYGLLSDQVLREFRIDIETDSTIRTDEDADRVARTEFLTAAGTYIDKAALAMQTAPELGPLLGELLMFGVRSFRSARTLEPVFEDAVKKMAQRQPSAMDPEMAKVQGELQVKREEMEMKAQLSEREQAAQAQQERERMQLEDQRAERDAQRQIEVEREKAQLHKEEAIAVAQIKAGVDLQVAQMQGVQQREELAMQERQGDKDRASNENIKGAEISASDKRQRDSDDAKIKFEDKHRNLDRESSERNADADRKVKEKSAKAKE
jgi:hypothetical protein